MLSREDNELLCRVGRGTPTGDLLRQYWIPSLMWYTMVTWCMSAERCTSGRICTAR